MATEEATELLLADPNLGEFFKKGVITINVDQGGSHTLYDIAIGLDGGISVGVMAQPRRWSTSCLALRNER